MRLALTLGLMASLIVLVGCTGGGCCGVADVAQPAAPTAYGSASGTVVHERAIRGVARPASRYERTVASFTAPDAPALPTARPVSRKVSMRSAPRTQPEVLAAPALPTPASDDCCPGGNCAIPSFDAECVGGNCAIPSLGFCK